MASVSTPTVLTFPSPIAPIITKKLKKKPATRSIADLLYCRATGHSKQVFPNSMTSNMRMYQDIRPTVTPAQLQASSPVVAASPAQSQALPSVVAASPARPQALPSVVDASCAHCNGPAAMNRCSRCKVVFYCNFGCQSADWSAHKLVCGIVRAEEATVAPAAPAATPVIQLSLQSLMSQFSSLQVVNVAPAAAAAAVPVSSNLYRKECINHFQRGGCNYERRYGTPCTFSHVHVKNLKHCICPEGAAERAAERAASAPSTVVNVVATARPVVLERRGIESPNMYALLEQKDGDEKQALPMGSYAQRASATMPAQVKKGIVQTSQDEKHEEENLYTLDADAIDKVIAEVSARPMYNFAKRLLSPFEAAQILIQESIERHVTGELRMFVPVVASAPQKVEMEDGVDVSVDEMAFMLRNKPKNHQSVHHAQEDEKAEQIEKKRDELVNEAILALTHEFHTISLNHPKPKLASRKEAIERALALRMEKELPVIEAETTTRQMKMCRDHFEALGQMEDWLFIYSKDPSTYARVCGVKAIDLGAIRKQVVVEHTHMLRKKVAQTSLEVVQLTEQTNALLAERRNAIYAEFVAKRNFEQDVHIHAHERTMLPFAEQLRAWADDHVKKAMMNRNPFCMVHVNGNEKPLKVCISTMRGINCMASECPLIHFVTRGENDGCCFFLKTYGKCNKERDPIHMREYYHPNGFSKAVTGKGVCQAGHLAYLNGTKIKCAPNCNVGTFVHHLNPQHVEVLQLMKKGEFADPMGLYAQMTGYVRRHMSIINESGWKTDYVVPLELTPQLAMNGGLVAQLYNTIKSVNSNRNNDVKMPNKYDFFVGMFHDTCDDFATAVLNIILEGQIKKVCSHNCQACPNGKHTIALQVIAEHRGKNLYDLAEVMLANPLRILDICEGDAFKKQCNCPSKEQKRANVMNAMSELDIIKSRLFAITLELAAYNVNLETVIDLKQLTTVLESMPAFHDITGCLETINKLEEIDVLNDAQTDLLSSLRVRVPKEMAQNADRAQMMKKIELYTRCKPVIDALQKEAVSLEKQAMPLVKIVLDNIREPMHVCRDMGARSLEEVNDLFKVPLPDKSEFKALMASVHQPSQPVFKQVHAEIPVVVNSWTEYLANLHEETIFKDTDDAHRFHYLAVTASCRGFSLEDWLEVHCPVFELWVDNFSEEYPNKSGYDRFRVKRIAMLDQWDRSEFASQEVDAFEEGDKKRGRRNNEISADKVSKKDRKQPSSENTVSKHGYSGANHQDHFTCSFQFVLGVPFTQDSYVFGNHTLEKLVLRGDELLAQLHSEFVNAVYRRAIPITQLARHNMPKGYTFMTWLLDKEKRISASVGVLVNDILDMSTCTFADVVEKYDELMTFRAVFKYTAKECPFKAFVQPEVYVNIAPFVDLAEAILRDKQGALRIITRHVEAHITSTLIEEDDLVLQLITQPEEKNVVALIQHFEKTCDEVHNFNLAVREFFFEMSSSEKCRLLKLREEALHKWDETMNQIREQEEAKATRKKEDEQLKAKVEQARIAKALELQQKQEAEKKKREEAAEAERAALAEIAKQKALDALKPVVVVSKADKLTKAEVARAAWEKSQADKEAARRLKQQEQEDQRKSKVRELSLAEQTRQKVAAEVEEKKQAKEERARLVAARPKRTMDEMCQERDQIALKVSKKEAEFFEVRAVLYRLLDEQAATQCPDKFEALKNEIEAVTEIGVPMGIELGVQFTKLSPPLTEEMIENSLYNELAIAKRVVWYSQEQLNLDFLADLKRQHEETCTEVEKEIEADRIQQELFVRPFREKVKREQYRKDGNVFQMEWLFTGSSITFKPNSANKFNVELHKEIVAKEDAVYERLRLAVRDVHEHVRLTKCLRNGDDVEDAQVASFQVCREHEEAIADLRVDISRLQIQQGGIPEAHQELMNRPLRERIHREFFRNSEVFSLAWFFAESPAPFKPNKANKFEFELQSTINGKERELITRVAQAVRDGLEHVRLNACLAKGGNKESFQVCRTHEEAIANLYVEIGYLQLQQGPMPVAQWSRYVAHINTCSGILDKARHELVVAVKEATQKTKVLLEENLVKMQAFQSALQSKLVKSKKSANDDDE